MTVIEKAPAKLNLGLRIIGKRDDGFHDILSIFQSVGLYDDLTMEMSAESGLECNVQGIPTDGNNLVLRAEKCFIEDNNIAERVHFQLKKRIPAGAGLGGGSSDAAAAFRGLRMLHSVDIDDESLAVSAAKLGSDIPFLVKGGTAIVSGRGEHVSYVDWPFDFTYVIVFPGFGVSTAWAYGSLDGFPDDGGAYHAVTEQLREGTLDKSNFLAFLRNDFEPVVFGKYPELSRIKSVMTGSGASASLMSGSGSSMFGIFEDDGAAERCADILRGDYDLVHVAKASA